MASNKINLHNVKKVLHFHLINGKLKWSDNLNTTICVRTFFNYESLKQRRKEYSDRKLVGYSMDQMFTVVSDVEQYKTFLPFCKQSDIITQREEFIKAKLTIGFPPVQECYVSNVFLKQPYLVRAVCSEGRLFDYLETAWIFNPGLKSNERSCIIDFSVAFQFRSLLHSQLAHLFFDQLVKQMENAFITEAARRYGKPSTKVTNLSSLASTTARDNSGF